MATTGVLQHPRPIIVRKAPKEQSAPPQGGRPKTPKGFKVNNASSSNLALILERRSAEASRSHSLPLPTVPTRRPLPRVPSTASIEATPSHTAPVSGASSSRRRPLPRPPSTSSTSTFSDRDSDDPEDSYPGTSSSSSSFNYATLPNSTPASRPRNIKPLPIPIQRTIQRRTSRTTPTKAATVPLVDALAQITPTRKRTIARMSVRSHSPPLLPPMNSSTSKAKRRSLEPVLTSPLSSSWEKNNSSLSTSSPTSPISRSPIPISPSYELTPRYVLRFSEAKSDDTVSESDPEDELHASIQLRYHDEQDFTMKYPDGEGYSWVLQDDVLSRQREEDVQGSKWYTERRGRRVTEKDYENIRNALRSL